MKIVTIVGARPQFIKVAAVSRAIQRTGGEKGRIQDILVHTGQHYDILMDRVFFEELDISKPDYHLGVGSGSHARQTGRMLEKIEQVLQKESPQVVIVYGDTNSTLAGALAAAKLNIPVAHVEAGLRSYQPRMAEEINRLLTDHLSTFLFCPTDQAVQNLTKEGIRGGKRKVVKKVGDVMYDSILHYSKVAENKSTILQDLNLLTPDASHPMNYYLATLHRAENTDDPRRLPSILKALNELAKKVPVVFPLHPRTKKRMKASRLFSKNRQIKFIEPLSYFNMVVLEKHAKAILTDSGGVQKEAYWFKVPCLILREETEWGDIVKEGWNRLVGFEGRMILEGIHHVEKKTPSKTRQGIFGDGRAGQKIVKHLVKHLG